MNGNKGRWAAVTGALQFAARGSAGRSRTGASQLRYDWHSRYVWVPMGGAQPSRSCCSPCFVMCWSCLKWHTLISPDRGNGKRRPTATVRWSLHTTSNLRMSCSDFPTKDSTSDLDAEREE